MMTTERQQLEQAIAALEAQRSILGDAVVDAAIGPMREKLASLTHTEPEQQRKLVTLLFCDVVGSTTMVRDLDPEDDLAIMDTGLKRLSAHVGELGGRVTRFMGDGFKALFGHPAARENDAEMAIRAGLAILQEAQIYASEVEQRFGVKGYTVRVGINTGLAIIGGESEGEDTVMGAAVNLAARMEAAAEPGTILISHDTYQHVRGVFDLEPREPVTAKGFEQPVAVYRVLRAKERAFRTRRRGVEGIETRMIGRHRELEILQEALRLTMEDGERQMVTLIGEPGLGKSRLLYEFENWVDLQSITAQLYRGRARQDARTVPYDLVRSIFAFRFEIQDGDPAALVRDKMTAGMVAALDDSTEAERNAHILGQLLGYDFAASPHVAPILTDAQQIRDRGLMYLVQYFKAASRNPLVILLEDQHWADDSSLDTITQLAMALEGRPVLIIAVARPELYQRRPHWFEGRAFHQRLALRPLSVRDSRRLVDEVLQKVELVPDSLRELVVSNAEGNPFYVEELIKMLIEEGAIVKAEPNWRVETGRLADLHVPPTLTGVLQARLDSLPDTERVVLQQASVVGRVFWDAVLAHLNQKDASTENASLVERLSGLRSREMIFHRDLSTFADTDEYIFKHALLRDVTYETVLKRLRQTYHELAAEWLAQVSVSQGRESEYAGLIAEHFEHAGRSDDARVWLRRAAESAAARFANAEAIQYYERLLPLLEDPAGQIDVRLKRGEVLKIMGKFSEAEADGRNALALAEQSDDAYTIARCQHALGGVFVWRGEYTSALTWLKQARTGWQALDASEELGRTLAKIGELLFRTGEFQSAHQVLSDGLALARTAQDRAYALINLGHVAYGQGHHTAAEVYYQESMAFYREINDKHGIAATFTGLGNVAFVQSDYAAAQTWNEECLRLAREIGDQPNMMAALVNLGSAELVRGNFSAAQLRYEESLRLSRQWGAKLGWIYGMIGLVGVSSSPGGNALRSARLAGAVEAMRTAIGAAVEPFERDIYDRAVAAARSALSEDAFAAAWAEGQAMTLDEAVAYALGEVGENT